MAWMIVKYAAIPKMWKEGDPTVTGLYPTWSAHDTYTGRNLKLKPRYEDHSEALQDLLLINAANPTCHYAVCPIIEGEYHGMDDRQES